MDITIGYVISKTFLFLVIFISLYFVIKHKIMVADVMLLALLAVNILIVLVDLNILVWASNVFDIAFSYIAPVWNYKIW